MPFTSKTELGPKLLVERCLTRFFMEGNLTCEGFRSLVLECGFIVLGEVNLMEDQL